MVCGDFHHSVRRTPFSPFHWLLEKRKKSTWQTSLFPGECDSFDHLFPETAAPDDAFLLKSTGTMLGEETLQETLQVFGGHFKEPGVLFRLRPPCVD